MTDKSKPRFKRDRSVTIEIRDRDVEVTQPVYNHRLVRITRALALLGFILLVPIPALGNSYFSGKFLEARCDGGPCTDIFDDGTRFITGKFYSVFDIRVSGRRARIGIITERGNRDYVEYTYHCTGFFCSKATPGTFLHIVKHWDAIRHRAAPYETEDFLTAYYRASLRVLGHPVGLAAFVLLAMVLFFFDRAGGAVLGRATIPVVPLFFGVLLVLCFLAGDGIVAQDERFREINTYLDSRRAFASYFYPLDYLPEVKYSTGYILLQALSKLMLTLFHIIFPCYIYWRWAAIVHGFYYYVVPDPRKKIIEAAIDGDLSLIGNMPRPTQRRWFANAAVMAASAHRLAEKLRADEEKQKARTKLMEHETELLRAGLRRERARHARKFLESRGGDHG